MPPAPLFNSVACSWLLPVHRHRVLALCLQAFGSEDLLIGRWTCLYSTGFAELSGLQTVSCPRKTFSPRAHLNFSGRLSSSLLELAGARADSMSPEYRMDGIGQS